MDHNINQLDSELVLLHSVGMDEPNRQSLPYAVTCEWPVERPQLGVALDRKGEVRGIERASSFEGLRSINHGWAVDEPW